MKKIIISLLSMTMLLSTSFSLTSCDSDDVEQVVQVASVVVNALLGNDNSTASIDGTAWVQLDDNNNGVALAFKGGNQGLWYTIQKNEITDIEQFGYSYDSSSNTLSIGSTKFTVVAFSANQSMTLQSGNDQYSFKFYDINQLPDPNQQDDDDDSLSDAFAGTGWYIQLANNQGFLLYMFETKTKGTLYQLDSTGQNVVGSVGFTYGFHADTNALNIKFDDGDTENWIVVGVDQDKQQLILQDAEGTQYTFTFYNQSSSSRIEL